MTQQLIQVPSINELITQHYDAIELKTVTPEMITQYYNHAMMFHDAMIIGSTALKPRGTALEVAKGNLQGNVLLSDCKAGKFLKEVVVKGGIVGLLQRHAELLQEGHTAINVIEHSKYNTLISGTSVNSVLVITSDKYQADAKAKVLKLVEDRLHTLIDLENEALLDVETVTKTVTELHEKLDKEYKEALHISALSSAQEAAQAARNKAQAKSK